MTAQRWLSRAVRPALLVTCLVGLTGMTGSLAWTATAGVLRRMAQQGGIAFDDLLVCCAVLVLAGAFGWLGLAALLTLGTQALRCTHTAAGRLARRITPSLLRRLLAGACGVAVLTAPTVTTAATAAPADHARERPAEHRAGPSSPRPGALPVPDRPTPRRGHVVVPVESGLSAPARGRGVAHPVPHRRVRVRPGDTLWAVAARHLPADADVAAVAAWWPVWFRHNRARIGPDPDLIHPGTRLRVPPRPH